MSDKKGFPVVLSSPSGGGKSTVATALIKELPFMVKSRSATTRQPRPGEKDGVDYDFISSGEFHKRLKNMDFVECARVHGNDYGTPRGFIEAECAKGKNPLLVIDVQGALQVRRHAPGSLLVFLMPPSLEELERRLRERGMAEEEIKLRLGNARGEIAESAKYDYIVLNDRLDHAVAQMREILQKERRERSGE